MGKVRKIRQKYHLSLKKSKSLNNLTEDGNKNDEGNQSNENLFKSTENIFANVDISWDDITKSLPKDFDVRSVISTKSRRELKDEEKHLKKKEKLKLRHDRFMQKLDVARHVMQNLKAKKKKQKKKKESNSLGGDMSSLLDALPSLQSLAVDASKKKLEKPKGKGKGILKAKHRLKQQSYDMKLFRKILDDKTFKANPLETINQYLKQKVAAES